jgi:hypothetical protein
MKRILALAACLVLGIHAVPAQTGAPRLYPKESRSRQFLCESEDPIVSGSVVELAESVRGRLAPLLGLKLQWKYKILFRIHTLKPDEARQPPYLSFRLRGGSLDLQVTASTPPPVESEDFLRCLVQALIYEKMLANRAEFEPGEPLPMLPLWLGEGILQALLEAHHEDWRLVVRRAAHINRAPGLREIAGWTELSTHFLERVRQQAFSYQLVRSLTRHSAGRADFIRRLTEADLTHGLSLRDWPDPKEYQAIWDQELTVANDRTKGIVYTWEQTASEFAALQGLIMRDPASEKKGEPNEDKPILARLDMLENFRSHPGLVGALRKKNQELLDLELRAQFSWRSVIATYRMALEQLPNAKAKPGYEALVAQARRELEILNASRDKIRDYLNWFEVTQTERGTSAFENYFTVRAELERFGFRPKDPVASQVYRIEEAL